MDQTAVSLLRRLAAAGSALAVDELTNELNTTGDHLTSLVRDLNRLGLQIENKQSSLRLMNWPERLIPEAIAAQLPENCPFASHISVYAQTSSSNDIALECGNNGGKHGEVVFALSQTAGRGRLQRSWHSAEPDGLWFSILLRPQIEPKLWARLGIATGIGIAQAAGTLCGRECLVKWPNDVLVGGRKLAGILLESKLAGQQSFLVVGVGINVNTTKFPEELQHLATSLKITNARNYNMCATAAKVLEAIWHELEAATATATLQQKFSALSYLDGHTVTVTSGPTELRGVAEGIDASGALRLRQADGSLITITAGDATLK